MFCFLFKDLIHSFIWESKRAWAGRGAEGGGGKRQRIEADLMPCTEPRVGLDLTTMRSRPKSTLRFRHQMDWATQVPPGNLLFLAKPTHFTAVRFEIASKVSTSHFIVSQQKGKKNVGAHFLGSLIIRTPTLSAGGKRTQLIFSYTEWAWLGKWDVIVSKENKTINLKL